MATRSSVLAWRILWIEESGQSDKTEVTAKHTHTSYIDKISVLHCFDDCWEGPGKEVMVS